MSTKKDETDPSPDNTAVRTALWRALHAELDAPSVFEDTIGATLVGPEEGWRNRPDMSTYTRPFRASIVARARFVEDLVETAFGGGVRQYVLLGAGLDTFVQRRPELASQMRVFEIDPPGPQAWKQKRLHECGFEAPANLRFVPVDFEKSRWMPLLREAGFDAAQPAVFAATGVSMYLTKAAVFETLQTIAGGASGSTFVMSFLLPFELLDAELRPAMERAALGARASGTPFLSFFTPTELFDLARAAGFREVEHVSAEGLGDRYFAGRADGLRPPKNAEELLVART